MSYDPRCYRCECRPCQCKEIARNYAYKPSPLSNLREAGVVEPVKPWNFGCTGRLSPKKLAAVLRVAIDDLESGKVTRPVTVYVNMTEYVRRRARKATGESDER